MADREIIHVLKRSDVVNRPLPSVLKHGEPIINSADGIMYFSGVTSSTNEWTPAGTGTTANFFEVGSNLYDLKLRNQLTEYQGISGGGLTGKFLSGTTSGFALADISDITLTGANGITTTTGNTVELGGTLTQDTDIEGAHNLTFGNTFANPNPWWESTTPLKTFNVVTEPSGGQMTGADGFVSIGSKFEYDAGLNYSYAALSTDPGSAYLRAQWFNNVGPDYESFVDCVTGQVRLLSHENNVGYELDLASNTGGGPQSATFTDSSATPKGLEYAANYHGTYTDRSLVDKEYVDNQITGATLTGANGITTTTGNTVELGGSLTQNTLITGEGKNLELGTTTNRLSNHLINASGFTSTSLSNAAGDITSVQSLAPGSVFIGATILGDSGGVQLGSGIDFTMSNSNGLGNGKARFVDFRTGTTAVGLEYAGNYHANYIDRSLVDKEYVDNQITGATLTGANGITITTGNTVELGGSLTQNTLITGEGKSLELGTTTNRLSNHVINASGFTSTSLSNAAGDITSVHSQTPGFVFIGATVLGDTGGVDFGAGINFNISNSNGLGNGNARFNDSRTGTTAVGLEYAGNYHANYIDRSLVDKEYVDNQITGATLTGANGITTTTGNTVELGGILSSDTAISGASQSINFGVPDSQLANFNVHSVQGNLDFSVPGLTQDIDFNPTQVRIQQTETGNGHSSDYNFINAYFNIQAQDGLNQAKSRIVGDSGTLRLQQSNTGDTTYSRIDMVKTGVTMFINSVKNNELNFNNDKFDVNIQDSGRLHISTGATSVTAPLAGNFFADFRTGATQSGLEYADDYSVNFNPLSLITKQYLDNAITGITGTLAANSMVYTDASGILTTEAGFTYDAGTDTMTVGNVAVQNGTGDTATFGQGGVTIGSGGVGDLTVQGDLTVLGDTTTVSTSQLYIEDPTITLNYSTGTTNVTSLGSGIEVQDGDGAGTDIYLKIEELNTAYASEYPATTGAGNRAFYTSLNDIVIRQATDTTSPSVGQVGKRVLAEDDVLDGGSY